MIEFFDSHTHTQFAVFKNNYKEVISRALSLKIGLINIGTQKETSLKAVNIALEFSNDPVYAAVGFHPIYAGQILKDKDEIDDFNNLENFKYDYEFYKNLAQNDKVVAIGECGLDYFRLKKDEDKIKQKEIFLNQMNLSFEIKKPLMIHCRNAFSDLIEILKQNKNLLSQPAGVVHFFTGTIEDAKDLLNLGFYFTFGGVITLTRDYDEIIRFLPLDRILSETDAPYVTPLAYRGKINEPQYIPEIVKKLAEIKNIAPEELKAQIIKNNEEVFKINLNF
jgi:TatD DNase family protein